MMKFPITLSSKVVGKGIQFLSFGVCFGSISVSKSLENKIGQSDLFLNLTDRSLSRSA